MPQTLTQLVTAEKIRIVCRNSNTILLGNLLGSVPLAIVLWSVDRQNIQIWLMSLYLILLVRFLYNRIPDLNRFTFPELLRFDRGQTLLIFLTGCIWGTGGYSFFDVENIQTVLLILLTFVSMIAGSLVSLSSRPVAYVCFSTPVMGPMIYFMFIQDEWLYNWLSFGAVVYLLATFGFSRTIHKVIDNSVRLRYENLDLIEDLRQETERANRANQDKSRFLASASHDLRQPLQAVNLFTEVLSGKVRDPDQRDDLANIQQGLGSLNELLDALFDVSRLDSELVKARHVSFPLDDLLGKLQQQFTIEARLRGLDFHCGRSGAIIDSDPMLLERVITNLLVNAFRYTPSGSVHVTFTDQQEQLLLHIEDTGIGIPEEALEEIFNEFYQVHNQERDQRQGLGLGLAIVRRVVALLGHKIEVTSQPEKGSVFTLTLNKGNAQSVPEVSEPDIPELASPLDGLHVMIVDNEESIVNAMSFLLTSWGAETSAHVSTREALDRLQNHEFSADFIIADYRMPGDYDGCEFVEAARSLIGPVPALIVTGDTSEDVVRDFRKRQFDYLHKPIKPVQLRMIIQRILARRS